ncbi:hypothetical protein PR202_gb11453 [Eleusine coracana subsp. coracana]|uniref:Chalcone/stilbene synthase N-terminal domain-containing protein n=1 Tax=Eleusine coracana subsp. coracana TaxID=191504 RepID=A0AAV5EKA1_ELECO|nr:hypothetical protein PR202_gb11453 [Eleusine coracana subsp. coracana]
MSLLLGNHVVSQATAAVSKADGLASVLGVGTANPANCLRQEDYADYYFRITKREHLTDLKAKFKRICHKSGISKRYFQHNEELLRRHPEFMDRSLPSLDIGRGGHPLLWRPPRRARSWAAASGQWGGPVPTTRPTRPARGPHAGDLRPPPDSPVRPRPCVVAARSPSRSARVRPIHVRPTHEGGGPPSRAGAARVLVACAESTAILFRQPDEEARVEALIMQALFGDGAGAVIVGASDPDEQGERPLLEMVAASQTMIPGTEYAAVGQVGEDGFVFYPSMDLPKLVGQNIESCVAQMIATICSGPCILVGQRYWIASRTSSGCSLES